MSNQSDTELKSRGLSAAQVEMLRQGYGENRLPEEAVLTNWTILLNQIKNPLVYIILVAAMVSLILGEWGDFAIIMVVVAADLILGFFQEYQAQKTYVTLKSLLSPTTVVIRDGIRQVVPVAELVPGDLVLLKAGDKIPADGTLLETIFLSLDESILTGESEPVLKESLPEDGASAGKVNKAFMGTTVITGRGTLRIDNTGIRTELGQIAASLSAEPEQDTPFQVRLKSFSRFLTKVVLSFTILILVIGLVMGRGLLEMLRTSIILAIAAVPEGLLIAVTVILVLGMRKILARKGLVKKLLAVETLGSVTVICTDKTGTLTEGRMRVTRTELADKERSLQTMVFCNNLEGPVDVALWEYAGDSLQSDPQTLSGQVVRLEEVLFSSETKYMITQVEGGTLDGPHAYLKGAPEIILGMCDVSGSQRIEILDWIDRWSREGLRILGLASRRGGSLDVRSGYEWAGLVAMEDPIREDVIESIGAARKAGIVVKMITGDYRGTAEHIAESIGLQGEDTLTIDGDELAAMNEEEFREKVTRASVFARIRPGDKLRIVEALQSKGEITAMIGDGVNDAPALRRADIGVVVGTATDIAKETSELILMDNRFSTIVAAIEEGRIIFANVRKVIAYMLSNSFAEVLTIFVAMLLQWPVPLTVAQILWIHLICDGPADLVLGFEPKEQGIMEEKPRPLKDPVLTRLAIVLIGLISVASAIFALMIFHLVQTSGGSVEEARSLVFASLAMNSMIYIFAYRSMRVPLYRMNSLRSNKPLIWAVFAGVLTILAAFWIPALRNLLGLVSLSVLQWGIVVGFGLLLLVIVEAGKWIANHRKG